MRARLLGGEGIRRDGQDGASRRTATTRSEFWDTACRDDATYDRSSLRLSERTPVPPPHRDTPRSWSTTTAPDRAARRPRPVYRGRRRRGSAWTRTSSPRGPVAPRDGAPPRPWSARGGGSRRQPCP